MNYNIINRSNGMVYEMFFESTTQLSDWLKLTKTFESLGPLTQAYLPTRHVRMQSR